MIRQAQLKRIIAELRGGVDGVVYDASVCEGFATLVIDAATNDRRLRSEQGEFVGTTRESVTTLNQFVEGGAKISLSMRSDFNNTSFVINDQFFAKLFRRVEAGTNPE